MSVQGIQEIRCFREPVSQLRMLNGEHSGMFEVLCFASLTHDMENYPVAIHFVWNIY